MRRELALRSVSVASPQAIARLTREERELTVVFVPDAFTEHFDPEVLLDAVEVAARMGFRAFVSTPHENGKALHVHGYLGSFERKARRTARYFDELAKAAVTLVGIDPSMTLTYRSEYAGSAATTTQARILLPQEWLASSIDRLPARRTVGMQSQHRLMAHCTERTNAPAAVGQWASIFARLGIDLKLVEAGCCGMAGTFGHEVRNREISEKLYAMSWQAVLAGAGEGEIVMATGYSCRSQVKLVDKRKIPHPLQIIRALLCEPPASHVGSRDV